VSVVTDEGDFIVWFDFCLNEIMEPLWGLDIGGTKIEGVVLESSQNPNVLCRLRLPTEANKGYVHIIYRIQKLVETMIAEVGIRPRKIGVGHPGMADPHTGRLKNSNTLVLNEKPLAYDLEKVLKIPIVLSNDANCFAVAETHYGVVKELAPNARMVFGVILGTGVGGGLVFDGKLWPGHHGIAGEWGHNIILEEEGDPCYCGKTGCVETVISGPALERYYFNLTDRKILLKEISERAERGLDTAAIETMERLTTYFGKAIGTVINILDPNVVVIGGGVGNIDLLYSSLPNSLKNYVFNDKVHTKFLKPSLGDSAGVFGAALL
jgi:fructokinase